MAPPPTSRAKAFTLVEIIVVVFIIMLILLLAVPSIRGAFRQRALDESFVRFDDVVREAQKRSVTEGKIYQIIFEKDLVSLKAAEEKSPVKQVEYDSKDAVVELRLPFAIEPGNTWTFWPTGNCEPAEIAFEGEPGTWWAVYDAMTTMGEIVESKTK